jgi:hypothetical protein
MDTINRSAVRVLPAKPFMDWLHRVDPDSAELTLEDLRRDASMYLLPEYDTEEEARGYLRECCTEIFEEQLDGWYRLPSAWPADRTFDTFDRWFEYTFQPLIFDLCDNPLKHD